MTSSAYNLIATMVLGYGLFKMLCGVFDLPSNREYKTIMAVGKQKKEKISPVDHLVFWLSHYLVGHISINPYKRKKLMNTLKSLRIQDTPEMVYAKAIVRGGVYIAFGFLLAVITPLLTALFVFLGVFVVFRDIQLTDKLILEKRDAIERELPQFVSTIEQELKYRTDVLGMLEDYRKNFKGALGDEIEVTITDMKSSNYENALSRLDARVGSSMLSEVVRGLIAVLRGDENVNHFHSLAMQFRVYARNRLDMELFKREERVRRYSFPILIAFMITILYPLLYDIMTTLPKIF